MTTPDTMPVRDRTVIVALSGGVDSAVAALLLKRQAARVQALHMTNWEDDDGYCTAARDLQDARRVCEHLDIPLHHINFAAEYRERVFASFLEEYRAGRTPNPDVLCNREIKFGVLADYAQRLGGELLATGHYARTARTGDGTALLKGVDRNKDQSYFLHAVSADALASSLFPLGAMRKSEVRALARDAGIATHDKKDSTGICFIGERPFREFLAQYLPVQPGIIRSADGANLGEHSGLAYYTLGQRHGLGVGGRAEAGNEPWYVAAKDVDRNELIVVQGEHPMLYSEGLVATNAHWTGTPPPALADGAFRCAAKIRYRQEDQPCTVSAIEGGLRVAFDTPQRAVAPGQYVVFYDGDVCLGGACIEQPLATREQRLAG